MVERIVAGYAVLGTLWVIGAKILSSMFFPSSLTNPNFWLLQGALFLLLTSPILYAVLKRKERMMEEEVNRFAISRTVLEKLSALVYLKDRQGCYLYVNPAFEKTFQVNSDQWKKKTAVDLFPGSFGEKNLENDLEIVRSGRSAQFEEQAVDSQGEVHHYLSAKFPLFAGKGELVGVGGISYDITDQKRTEEELRMREERLRLLLAIRSMDEKSLKEVADAVLEAATKLTDSPIGYLALLDEGEKVLTMHAWSSQAMDSCAVPEPTRIFPLESTGLWGEAVRQRKPIITNDYAASNSLKRGLPEGHIPLTRHMNVPLFDGERIVALLGVGNKKRDYLDIDIIHLELLLGEMMVVTRSSQGKENLRLALREKELLLRELHHRVKNNLQVVSSLLNLQASRIESKEVKSLFNTARNRITAMSLLQEQLYRSQDFSGVKLKEYVQTLMSFLFRSYLKGEHGVVLQLDVSETMVTLEEAMPLGLILNEVVSNSLVHALKGRSEGRIAVRIEECGEELRMEVEDDGVGLDPSFDKNASEGLGLQLVSSLAGQLLGSFEFLNPGSGPGTLFTLSYPRPMFLKTKVTKEPQGAV